MKISASAAEGVMESLRLGIPPRNFGKLFTVGRDSEMLEVEKILNSTESHSHLIQGNYGEGKSHLLEAIKESALLKNYLVSSVTIDSRGGVRFNRMDQIVSAVVRNLTFSGSPSFGVDSIFERFVKSNMKPAVNKLNSSSLRMGISNWADSSEGSPRRTYIRSIFYDTKSPGYINWQENNYFESWQLFNDLQNLSLLSGLSGIALFFDEFEDVIQNLNNRIWQQKAFENFFRMTNPKYFNGKIFFGVTPEFSDKSLFLMRNKYFGNVNEAKGQLENLPKFGLKNITLLDFQLLADRVCEFHSIAYQWNAVGIARNSGLDRQIQLAFHARGINSTRLIVQHFVEWLDRLLEESS